MSAGPVVVVAAVIERGGRILISQRRYGAGHGGRWEFPGGKREPGETDRRALARELAEELGIEVRIGRRIWSRAAGPLHLRFYRCGWLAGGRPRSIGNAQFRWVRREDLAGYDFPPADRELVARLVAGGP